MGILELMDLNFVSLFIILNLFIFWPHLVPCGILVPWTRHLTVVAWSSNNWTSMEFLYVVDSTYNWYNIFLQVFIRMVDLSHSISHDLNSCKYCIYPASTSPVEVTFCHTDTRSGPCWLSISSTMQGPLGNRSRAVCRSHGNSDTGREKPSGFFQEACRKLFL